MGCFSLDRLGHYNACVVESVGECAAKARLTDLGVIPGACIVWLFSAPCGEPTAYYVGGAVIALRKSEARNITVRGIE